MNPEPQLLPTLHPSQQLQKKRRRKKPSTDPLPTNLEHQLNNHPKPLLLPLDFPSLLRDNHPPPSSLPNNHLSSTKKYSQDTQKSPPHYCFNFFLML
ncbi:hypothetical protein GBA52_024528 [Prunus armeniaca]|nr:hypothetical protein GBA52_024528 [Prunus armeniaca]